MSAATALPKPIFYPRDSNARIERTVQSLEENNIRVHLAKDGAEAKKRLSSILPARGEALEAYLTAMNSMMVVKEFSSFAGDTPGKMAATMIGADPQNHDPQKFPLMPGWLIGGVHAITENEGLLIISITGAQLVRYVSGEVNAVWIMGTRKIVSSKEEGLARVAGYLLPPKNVTGFRRDGERGTDNTPLIIYKEYVPGRSTVILVKEHAESFPSNGGKRK